MRSGTLLRVTGPTVVVVAAWVAAALLTGTSIDEAEQRGAAATQQLVSQQRIDRGLTELAAVESDVRATIARIEAALPADVDVAQLIDLLAEAADGEELVVRSIAPVPTSTALVATDGATSPADGVAASDGPTVSRIPITASGLGTYEATLAYLDRLSQSERLFVIRSIELVGDRGGATEIGFSIELDAFTTRRVGAAAALPAAASTTAPPPVIAFEEE